MFKRKNVKQDYKIDFKQLSGLNVENNTELFTTTSILISMLHFLLVKVDMKKKEWNFHCLKLKKKNKELCKGFVDLAKYADLNGQVKDVKIDLKGKSNASVHFNISSLTGEPGSDSDETEVLQIKTTNTDNIHDLKKEEQEEQEEEQKLAEQQKKLKLQEEQTKELLENELKEQQSKEQEPKEQESKEQEPKEQEPIEQEPKEQPTDNSNEKKLFATAASNVNIKGKKDKKKKYTENDLNKAVEKAVATALVEKKKKYKKNVADLNEKLNVVNKQHQEQMDNLAKEKDDVINELNAKIQNLENEVKDKETIQASLTSTESERNDLQQNLENEKKQHEEEQNKKDATIDELNKKIEEQNSKVNEEEHKNEEANTKIQQLEEQLNNKISDVETSAAAGSASLLAEKNKEIEDIKTQKKSLEKELSDYQKEIEKLKEQNENGNNLNEKLNVDYNELQKQLSVSNNEVTNHEEEINSLKKELMTIKENLDEKEQHLISNKETITTLKEEIEQLKSTPPTVVKETNNEEIERLQNVNKEIESKLEEAELTITNKNDTIENLKEEIKKMESLQKMKKTKKSSSSSSSSEEDNVKDITTEITKLYIQTKNQYDNSKPLFAVELQKYCTGNKEIDNLEILKTFGDDTFETAIYNLLTIVNITNDTNIVSVKSDGTLHNQLLDLQHFLFTRVIKIASLRLTGFIEGMVKDNHCFERRKAAEFEQVTGTYIGNYFGEIYTKTGQLHVPNPLQNKIIIQLVNYVSYAIIHNLLDHEELITCAKGFQLKFFCSIIEGEMSKNPKISPFRKYLSPAIEVASLLVLDHTAESFDDEEISSTFTSLNATLIYNILSKFKTDSLNTKTVDKKLLDSLRKSDAPIPTCFDLVN
ncbi:C2 NT-type domain-containing protein [Entamoeba marina]